MRNLRESLRRHLPVALLSFALAATAACQTPFQRHWHDGGGDYLGATALPLIPLVPPYPPADSTTGKAELAELHRLEQSRTPAETAAAKADDVEEDIWIYRTVLGPGFSPEKLPITAAFQQHVLSEAVAASATLKDTFLRLRPYALDPTLHPICGLTKAKTSYPSGHSTVGYLMGFTLTEMVPEKQEELLRRADNYAHNRLVCGVHYASDAVTAKLVSYIVFGELMKSPKFVEDLKAARAELRDKLKLGAIPYEGWPK